MIAMAGSVVLGAPRPAIAGVLIAPPIIRAPRIAVAILSASPDAAHAAIGLLQFVPIGVSPVAVAALRGRRPVVAAAGARARGLMALGLPSIAAGRRLAVCPGVSFSRLLRGRPLSAPFPQDLGLLLLRRDGRDGRLVTAGSAVVTVVILRIAGARFEMAVVVPITDAVVDGVDPFAMRTMRLEEQRPGGVQSGARTWRRPRRRRKDQGTQRQKPEYKRHPTTLRGVPTPSPPLPVSAHAAMRKCS